MRQWRGRILAGTSLTSAAARAPWPRSSSNTRVANYASPAPPPGPARLPAAALVASSSTTSRTGTATTRLTGACSRWATLRALGSKTEEKAAQQTAGIQHAQRTRFVHDPDQGEPSIEGWDREPVFAPLVVSRYTWEEEEEHVKEGKAVPRELMRRMGQLYLNGGVLFARLAALSDARLDWFVRRGRVHEIKLLEHLLASNVLLAALPEVKEGNCYLMEDPIEAPEWVECPSNELADCFADQLQWHGAYTSWEEGRDEAIRIGQRACNDLFGSRTGEQLIFTSTRPWCGWFLDVAWDFTCIGVDLGTRQAWLLCATDSDLPRRRKI
ncbi:uncharacterized protein ACA1_273490 [Acanthamoeba castellanii str. Neff]|uniref:Uncharacterized protein n=1 Tax=Acanthamoeba castellanii (strain ATCC 30010 / Neff) TaxID=1257118 RepID=L8GGI1_ACACF|nr:uncharacterized protein ACA1_273490 [Acanthamoeba castellanii str. Neff]ELR11858.1 hypothetical protein ACA1_273490 [Acanthamoeba castellanii str. Neff]